jgi:hypothetical protein
LVLGSYPPVPGAPAAATVAAVRRAWQSGAEVVVVSPRPSAAPFVVALAGPALGREVAKLRLVHGCNKVVLCLEPGWPFAGSGPAATSTARALAQALCGFESAEIVVTGELGVAPEALAPLWPLVEKITASSQEAASQLGATGGPLVSTVDPFAGSGLRPIDEDAGSFQRVGPLEPAELLVVARGRRALGKVARKVLGSHAPAVRLYLRRLLRPSTGRQSQAKKIV